MTRLSSQNDSPTADPTDALTLAAWARTWLPVDETATPAECRRAWYTCLRDEDFNAAPEMVDAAGVLLDAACGASANRPLAELPPGYRDACGAALAAQADELAQNFFALSPAERREKWLASRIARQLIRACERGWGC